ncbi:MAG: hypothetical protein ACKOGA_01390 [Planctomycetaceae bacterium]
MPSSPSSRQASQYNPRRDRRRIQWAVLSLAIVLIAMAEARKPENWNWLAPASSGGGLRTSSQAATGAGFEADELEPDQVRLIAPAQPRGGAVQNPRWPREDDLRVPPDQLLLVADNRVGVRAQERPAMLAMLERARSAGNTRLGEAAQANLPFATLMNDPGEHRGEIANVEGELRRYFAISAGENDLGLDMLYEGWLFTDEAGRTNPYRIVCASRTPGLAEGGEVRERVRIPAYFFKRLIYATAHGQHSAPMFVGDRFEILPRKTGGRSDPGRNVSRFLTPATAILAVLLGSLIYLTARHFSRRESRGNSGTGDWTPGEGGTEISKGAELEPIRDPREFLRELAANSEWEEGETGLDPPDR